MLNYDDSDQTLLQFYKTTDLASPVPERPAQCQLDPQALGTLPLAQQLDAINRFLAADHAVPDPMLTDHDHKDPLDGSDLVHTLVKKGRVSSATDPAIARYLVSSQHFDAPAYLSVVHEHTPIEQLMASLGALDATIRFRTSELKSVLHENFESFLTCKKAIDGILANLRDSKSRAQQDMAKSKVFNPAARRNLKNPDVDSSLLSELEESINNLNLSSSLMIRPIMDHNAKEVKIKALIDFIQANKFLFDLPCKFVGYLSAQDHDSLVADYNRFLAEKEEIETRQSRDLGAARASGDDAEVHMLEQKHTMQNTALARVFKEIGTIAEEYRKKCLSDLLSMDHEVNLKSRKLTSDVKFIDLVKKLHRMDTPGSSATPIYDFLSSQLDKIEAELVYQHDKFKTRFSAMQKKLLDYITSLSEQRQNGSDVKYIAEKFDSVEEYFKASSSYTTSDIGPEKERIIIEIFENNENLDLSIINETWLVLSNFIKYFEEFSEFKMAKFVKNYVHYASDQNGYNVDPQGVLKTQFFRILNEMISRITDIFSAQVTTDQMKVTPSNYSAFLPYHTNSLSAIFYLSQISRSKDKLFTVFGNYTTEIGNLSKSLETNKRIKSLKEVSEALDQRILEAICATWANDCSQFYDLENWEKYKVSGDKRKRVVVYTKVMQLIYYYELFVLEKLEALLNRKADGLDSAVRIVSSYPSKKVLMSLEIQFMRSMNVLIDSSVKKFAAEKANMDGAQANEYETEQCIYKILTMNNFTALGEFVFPKLIAKFDSLFGKTLSKQNLKLFADLDKVKITILDDINEIEKAWIEAKIEKHFVSVQRSGLRRSIEIDPFVYHCLLHFVKLLHVLKPITDVATFVAIMQQLQTQFLIKFLQCLREASEKEQVIVRILGNMKLDLDFFAEVFEASDTLKLDEYCLNLVQIILGQIDKVEKMFTDLGYTQNDIDQKLYQALQNSGNEFTCFM